MPPGVKVKHFESKEVKEIERMKRILELQEQDIQKKETKAYQKQLII